MAQKLLDFPRVKSRPFSDKAVTGKRLPPSNDDELTSLGLPGGILDYYRQKGVEKLFPWQVECFAQTDVLRGRNLVVSAPTSSGKTMIADILMIKHALEKRKKCLFVLPFVALAREKMFSLQRMFKKTKISVGGFMGGQQPFGGFESVNVAVCTIERANNIINRLIEEKKLHLLSLVIIDELHLVGDPNRGYLLELIATKLQFLSESENLGIQILGMSATLPNVKVIANWINADLYVTSFRPIQLREFVKVDDSLLGVNGNEEKKSISNVYNISDDKDHIKHLVLDTIVNGFGALIFCPLKRLCEELAWDLRGVIQSIGHPNSTHKDRDSVRNALSTEAIKEVISQLDKLAIVPDKQLKRVISYGVAYHHAGLTTEERDIIEDAFRKGKIKAIFATSTLSAGVNIPARRVIIYSPFFRHGKRDEILDVTTYKQMIGRAGRMGIDTEGESILICRENEKQVGFKLARGSLKVVESALINQTSQPESLSNQLTQTILEAIVLDLADTNEKILEFLHATLIAKTYQNFKSHIADFVARGTRYLIDRQFIQELQESGVHKYIATKLGRAVIASSMTPNDGLSCLNQFAKAQFGLILCNDVHLLYHITPGSSSHCVWNMYKAIWSSLTADVKKVAEVVGVEERIIFEADVRGATYIESNLSKEKLLQYYRFYSALILNDLINEMPPLDIEKKYGVRKGDLQNMQKNITALAWMTKIFCQKLGWQNLEVLIDRLHNRLCFGVQLELLDLIGVSLLNNALARTFFDNGYKKVVDIAKADSSAIKRVLFQYGPFKTDDEMRQKVWLPTKSVYMHIDDLATELIKEARTVVEQQWGVCFDWETDVPGFSFRANSNVFISENFTSGAPTKLDAADTEMLDSSSLLDYGESSLRSIRDSYLETDDREEEKDNKELPDSLTSSNDLNATPEASPQLKRKRAGSFYEIFDESSGDGFDIEAVSPLKNAPEIISSSKEIGDVYSSDLRQTRFASTPNVTIPMNGSKKRKDIEQNDKKALRLISPTVEKRMDETVKPCFISELKITKQLVLHFKIVNKRHECRTIIGANFGSDAGDPEIADGLPFNNGSTLITAAVMPSHMTVYLFEGQQNLNDLRDMLKNTLNMWRKQVIIVSDLSMAYAIFQRCFFFSHEEISSLKWFEPRLAYWLLNPASKVKEHSELIDEVYPDCLVTHMRKKTKTIDEPNQITSFFARQCLRWQLFGQSLIPKLKEVNLHDVYWNLELTSYLISLKMTFLGIGVDKCILSSNEKEWSKLLEKLEEAIEKQVGFKINLDSPKQVKQAINTIKEDKGCLEQLVHDHRRLKHMLTNVVSPILSKCYWDEKLNMHRVSGRLDYWTATGRMQMSNANLMCVNNNFGIEVDHNHSVISVRAVFVPRSKYCLMSADFTQLELRILAHFSGDPTLKNALSNGEDVFSLVAARLHKKELKDVTSRERQHAKEVCYGMIYGIGTKELAKKLNTTEAECEKFMSNFFDNFKKVNDFLQDTVEEARSEHYVATITGRRRKLPGFSSRSRSEQAKAERVAVNTKIQGTASDIVKKVLVAADRVLAERNIQAFLVLQIHDELLYEVNVESVGDLRTALEDSIKETSELSVPLTLKFRHGDNWANLINL